MKLIILISVVAISGLVGCAPEQLVTGNGQEISSMSLIQQAEIELQSASPSVDALSGILAGLEQQRLDLQNAGLAVPDDLDAEIKRVADAVAEMEPPAVNADE